MIDSTPLDAWSAESLSPDGMTMAGQPPASPASLAAKHKELLGLYHSHRDKVVGYFRRCGCSEALAHDLAQETFVNALKGLARFDGRSKLSTWVWAIARNVFLTHLRSRPDEDSPETKADPDTLSNGDDPHLMAHQDGVRRGFAAFARLYPDRAQVVYVAVVEGWTREELAQYLGRSVHAATVYLADCKDKLRPFLKDCNGS